jgi:saccharopine dehydrogenase (NAD+, L-lysine forming)
MLKIGIIKEGKIPADNRVALTPLQCKILKEKYSNIHFKIFPSSDRCFSDAEYKDAGVELSTDLNDRDILLGIKEVPIDQLIENKTYFFFSHTIKFQKHNQKLLRAAIDKNIALIDYEVLTNYEGERIIAFGKYAGVVGAYNGLMGFGNIENAFQLPRLHELHDYSEAKEFMNKIQLPPLRIVLTGMGRVAFGAAKVLDDFQIEKVSPEDFLNTKYEHAIYTQLSAEDYVERIDHGKFVKSEFYKSPELYQSKFQKFLNCTDLLINGIFYDNKSPSFFTIEDMRKENFNIKVIADITCDLMPHSSIPSTLKATTIREPFYYFDAFDNCESNDAEGNVLMMTIDNLPNELPRDASEFFGRQFVENVMPHLLEENYLDEATIMSATMTRNGKLTKKFSYLQEFVDGIIDYAEKH